MKTGISTHIMSPDTALHWLMADTLQEAINLKRLKKTNSIFMRISFIVINTMTSAKPNLIILNECILKTAGLCCFLKKVSFFSFSLPALAGENSVRQSQSMIMKEESLSNAEANSEDGERQCSVQLYSNDKK